MKKAVRGATLLLYASVQFLILTLVAMVVFPGGTRYSPDATRYLFFRNFFSDLGATHTVSGKPNPVSAVLFIIAAASVGLALVVTSGVWKSIEPKATALGRTAQVFAVLAGICFVGIAATPWNLLLREHNFFVKLGFSLLLGLTVSTLLLQKRAEWPPVYVWLNWLYVALLLSYVYILFEGPRLTTENGLAFQVTAQKIVIYSSILNLGTQAYGVRCMAIRGDEFVNRS
jgi:hypothetical protein